MWLYLAMACVSIGLAVSLDPMVDQAIEQRDESKVIALDRFMDGCFLASYFFMFMAGVQA